MPRYYRYGPRMTHHGHPFKGLFWLIALGILIFAGHWWPAILILIGISMLLSATWNESDPQPLPDPEYHPQPIQPMAPVQVAPAPVLPTPAAPVNIVQHLDQLPSTCPRCGAPVRSNEVKWTSSHSAACSYCGSTLPVKKNG